MAVRYQAIGPLLAGEGSRAFLGLEVYEDGRSYPVVLVWLPEGAGNDKNLLAKAQRETEHAAKLDHPNIVRVMGFGHLDEGYARVVEYADGEPLRKIERAGKIPPKLAAKIVCDAATGVHYAHVAGNDDGTPLVHGDVRPETLLISFNGVVKVTGYERLAFAPREMGGQRVKGRRVHTAPEQIIGGRESYALQTDVYLLGVTLYECLTGKVPFADQAEFFDHAVLTLPVPPMEPGLAPEGLEAIVNKACAKKVNERYATPLALREAIEGVVGTLPANEELAAWLKDLFPGSDEVRAARRQTIDTAIADAARKLWGDKTKPMPTAAPVVSAPVAKPAPKPQPELKISYQPPPEPERKSSSFPWALVLTIIIAGAAVFWFASRSDEQLPSTKSGLAALADAGPKTLVEPVAVASALDASVAEPADAAMAAAPSADSGAPAALAVAAPVLDAGATANPEPEPAPRASPTALALDTQPSTDVTIDGKIAGRTPLRLETTPGKKTVLFENKDLGISTTRVLTVKEGGTDVENISFGTGLVVLSAPDGSAVFMDGKRIGTAPMQEIKVYEGGHRILVTVGKAKWSEPFTMHAGDNVRFNVDLE